MTGETEGEKRHLNPYAPTILNEPSRDPSRAGGLTQPFDVIQSTILSIALAGSVFGIGVLMLIGLVATLREGWSSGAFLGFAFGMIGYGLLGFAIALIPAIVVVPIGMAIKKSGRDPNAQFTGSEVKRFGAMCGFFSGSLPIGVMSLIAMQPIGFLIASVPGVVGMLLTPFFMRKFARRVDWRYEKYQAALAAESPDPAPESSSSTDHSPFLVRDD